MDHVAGPVEWEHLGHLQLGVVGQTLIAMDGIAVHVHALAP